MSAAAASFATAATDLGGGEGEPSLPPPTAAETDFHPPLRVARLGEVAPPAGGAGDAAADASAGAGADSLAATSTECSSSLSSARSAASHFSASFSIRAASSAAAASCAARAAGSVRASRASNSSHRASAAAAFSRAVARRTANLYVRRRAFSKSFDTRRLCAISSASRSFSGGTSSSPSSFDEAALTLAHSFCFRLLIFAFCLLVSAAFSRAAAAAASAAFSAAARAAFRAASRSAFFFSSACCASVFSSV